MNFTLNKNTQAVGEPVVRRSSRLSAGSQSTVSPHGIAPIIQSQGLANSTSSVADTTSLENHPSEAPFNANHSPSSVVSDSGVFHSVSHNDPSSNPGWDEVDQ